MWDKSWKIEQSTEFHEPTKSSSFLSFYIYLKRGELGAWGKMGDFLAENYPWILSLHIMSVISWMAGIFYLPRLFVYHAEQSEPGDARDQVFQEMEVKLLRVIMGPASVATWIFGLLLVFTPGIVDWSSVWPWTKAAAVLVLTWYHHWLGWRRKDFVAGKNVRSGRSYRMMNEVPTVLMVIIVISVVVKF